MHFTKTGPFRRFLVEFTTTTKFHVSLCLMLALTTTTLGKSKDSIVFYLTELLRTRWGTEYGNISGIISDSDSSSLFTNIIQVRSRAGWKRGDLSILRIDPWTQSTVWYFLKPILIAVGIPIKDSTREYVTSIIKDVCSKLDGSPTREELGIIASARAMLFFEEVWMSVDMDRVSELAEKGTDLSFIEKRGGVEIVTKFIGDSGMSFCNTQGHFVYYAKDLAREFKISGGHPSVTTDCDCAGINIAERVMVRENTTDGDQVDDEDEEYEDTEDEKIIDERLEEMSKEKTDDSQEEDNVIQRIGIDSDTLLYFGITAAEVEEEYPPKPLKNGKAQMNPGRNVTNPIVKMANKYWDNPIKFVIYRYIADNLSYLVGRTTLRIMADKCRQDSVKYGLYKTINDNLEYLTGLDETPIGIVGENAKRIEIDSVIKRVGGKAFANYILDMHHIIFHERNFNRTSLKLKKYFGEKFDILPEPLRKFFIHIANVADAAAEKTEKQIESDQEHVKGFPYTVTDKKKENVNKISKAILKDPDMKLLISTIKQLPIIQYFDNPNIKEIAEKVGLSLKEYLHGLVILEKGTEQQKQDWESGKRKTEAIYQEIMKHLITG
jgi:hypothetical protein